MMASQKKAATITSRVNPGLNFHMHEEKNNEKHFSDRDDEGRYRIPIDCVSSAKSIYATFVVRPVRSSREMKTAT
jgi:hypothetical protein